MKTKIPSMEFLSEELKNLNSVLNSEPDFITVIVGTSFVETCLKSIIQKKLVHDKKSDNFINNSSLYKLLELGYALGVINNDLYSDIDILRRIRNEFAHRYTRMKISDENILSLIEQLKIPKRFDFIKQNGTAWDYFNFSVSQIANRIIVDGLSIKPIEKPEIEL